MPGVDHVAWTSRLTRSAAQESATEILGTGGIKPLQASMDNNTRQGDMADQASGNNEVHIQLKLKQTDAKILQAIEEALARIDKGTYGICRDCGEPIAAARLKPSRGPASASPARKNRTRDRPAPALQEFYREKLAALLSHQAAARLVGQYDANNTYQYIINREETQLSWLPCAIVELGRHVGSRRTPCPKRSVRRARAPRRTGVFEEDARDAQAFVDRWRPRVEAMANARHRGMLRVILGETLEQKRFFEQALRRRYRSARTASREIRRTRRRSASTRWIE